MEIRPAASIQNDYRTMFAYCKQQRRPVFLTDEGEGEYVLMSKERYEAYNEMLKLRAKILEAELQYERGEYYTQDEVEAYLEAWLNDGQ